jgi:hypothetical protein
MRRKNNTESGMADLFLDFFAALYQVGKISISPAIFEVLVLLVAVVFFCITLRFVYRKMREN